MPVSRAALTILAATILANEAPCELLVSGERQHLGPSGNAEHKPQSVRLKTRDPIVVAFAVTAVSFVP